MTLAVWRRSPLVTRTTSFGFGGAGSATVGTLYSVAICFRLPSNQARPAILRLYVNVSSAETPGSVGSTWTASDLAYRGVMVWQVRRARASDMEAVAEIINEHIAAAGRTSATGPWRRPSGSRTGRPIRSDIPGWWRSRTAGSAGWPTARRSIRAQPTTGRRRSPSTSVTAFGAGHRDAALWPAHPDARCAGLSLPVGRHHHAQRGLGTAA